MPEYSIIAEFEDPVKVQAFYEAVCSKDSLVKKAGDLKPTHTTNVEGLRDKRVSFDVIRGCYEERTWAFPDFDAANHLMIIEPYGVPHSEALTQSNTNDPEYNSMKVTVPEQNAAPDAEIPITPELVAQVVQELGGKVKETKCQPA
ncbi:hypothetical protein ACFLZ6_02255 [Nanoarchaeota archaeon]